MKLPIYLDYSATTPVDPRVAAKMVECLTIDGNFGNPASRSHAFGWRAEEAVENARRQVAELVNADPREIVWTSGATESDNLAIKGVAHFYASKGKHIVTTKIEHKAVLDTTRQLEREGFEVTYIEPGEDGIITPAMVEAALREDTILVSVMHVNNEIGTINDIAAIGELTRARGVLFHVDAAQSTGKVEIDLEAMKVDLMSFSAHKTYGPKGVGALYVRRKPRVRLEAQMHGGGHERGMRSGTLATHQLVGMGEAFRIAKEEMVQEREHIRALRDRFFQAGRASGRVVCEWQHDRPGATQPQPQLQLCGRRVVDHGTQGPGSVIRFCLYLRIARAFLRVARIGAQRRTGAQLDSLHLRSFHHGGRSRLRSTEGQRSGN